MRLRRRQGRRENLLAEYGDVVVTVATKPEDLKPDWRIIFGRSAPLLLEIGIGKGRFINCLAEKYPENDYIGIELEDEIMFQAAKKVRSSGVGNIRLITMNAMFLLDVFNPHSIGGIYLNFSDPWPKARHAKRRLTAVSFLQIYRQLLIPGGIVVLKTDDKDFFEYSLQQFTVMDLMVKNIVYDWRAGIDNDDFTTEYEVRFASQGKIIYRCEASCN